MTPARVAAVPAAAAPSPIPIEVIPTSPRMRTLSAGVASRSLMTWRSCFMTYAKETFKVSYAFDAS